MIEDDYDGESEFDFFEELMSEPPGGHNHGWKRTIGGGWISLDTEEPDRLPPRLPTPSEHGTLTKYSARGCRCDACRKAYADWRRERRIMSKHPE